MDQDANTTVAVSQEIHQEKTFPIQWDKARKEWYWRSLIKLTDRYERLFVSAMKKIFGVLELDMHRNLDRLGPRIQAMLEGWSAKAVVTKAEDRIAEVLYAEDEWAAMYKGQATPIARDAFRERGQEAMDVLGTQLSFNVENERARKWIGDRAKKYSKLIDKTTRTSLKKTLTEGFKEGESIPKLKKRVSAVIGDAERRRAYAIARTEILAASNEGTLEGYRQSGVVEGKQIVTALDERVCPICGPMEGQTVGLEQNFHVPGGADAKVFKDATLEKTPPFHVMCYSPDTEVRTKRGWLPFPEVKKDDLIWSQIPDEFRYEWVPIKEMITYHHKDKMLHLSGYGWRFGERVRFFDFLVTPDHPFYGYRLGEPGQSAKSVTKQIDDLHGDFNFIGFDDCAEGMYISIEDVEIERIPYDGMVYDLELERNHNFAVRRPIADKWWQDAIKNSDDACAFFGSNCRCGLIPVLEKVELPEGMKLGTIPEKEWIKSLKPNEKIAFNKWSGPQNLAMRKYQQTGKVPVTHTDVKEQIIGNTQAIESAISRAKPYDGTVYRGMSVAPEKLLKAKTIEWDALSSASYSEEEALLFTQHEGILFKIRNKSGVKIDKVVYEHYADEKEVMLRKGAKYRRVGNVKYLKSYGVTKKSYYLIELQEI